MPRGDRTGPDGMGPRTGRALGYCAGYDRPGYTQGFGGFGGYGRGGGFGWRGRGRGFGYGFAGAYGVGRGRMYRNYAYPPVEYPYDPAYTQEEALTQLKNEENVVSKELEGLQKRIKELEEKVGKDESSDSNR